LSFSLEAERNKEIDINVCANRHPKGNQRAGGRGGGGTPFPSSQIDRIMGNVRKFVEMAREKCRQMDDSFTSWGSMISNAIQYICESIKSFMTDF